MGFEELRNQIARNGRALVVRAFDIMFSGSGARSRSIRVLLEIARRAANVYPRERGGYFSLM